jgi:ABC-type glycerol-3-phosphate transport system substrate-binding protein
VIARCAQTLTVALCALALTACAAPSAAARSAQATIPVGTPTPSATPTAVPSVINVWFPALFAYESELFTATQFSELVQDYARHAGHIVNVRLRRADGLGGIFETLNSAAQVAPSVLPDLVLMRARDLPRAAAARLIAPLSPNLLPQDAYFTAALALARYDGEFYGIPHFLELQHAIYRGDSSPPLAWQTLISRQVPYLFSARVARGANSTLLSHYIALGGKFADQNGEPLLDYEPLLIMMSLYDEARRAGSLLSDVLDYAEPTQYWTTFLTRKNTLAQVDSTFYLRQRAASKPAEAAAWQVAALPYVSSEEASLSLVDGWLWALTTAEPERQRRALALIEWLQEPRRLAAFSERVNMLPARRTALNAWSAPDYAAFAARLLDRTPSPLPESVNVAVAEALQESFARLLKGELSAEAAASAALDRVRAARER